MPIRPENKDRYPANWKAISKAVRDAAGNQCEQCGAPNGARILRGDYDGRPTYAVVLGIGCHVYAADDGEYLGVRLEEDLMRAGWSPVRVILTVAHLDHTPENCAPDNLRAWCQRCHNTYDAPMRAEGRKARREAAQ